MAVRTEIVPDQCLVRQYIEGELSLAELQLHIEQIIADPRVTKGFSTLSFIGDLTNAFDEGQQNQFAAILRRLGTLGPEKCAVVCKRAFNVATTQVFYESTDLSPLVMRAFDNERDALSWLREA